MWQGYSRNQAHSTSFHPRGVTPGTWILPLPSASFRKEEDYQLFTTLFSRKTSLNPSFLVSFLLNELKKRAGVDDEKGWLRRLYFAKRLHQEGEQTKASQVRQQLQRAVQGTQPDCFRFNQ